MGFVIPSSNRKRHLSGADWIIITLDCMLKAVTCAGNMSQIVLVLDREIEETFLRAHLNSFIREFPVVGGSISRDLNLAPYWRIPKKVVESARFSCTRLDTFSCLDDALPFLEQFVNRPFKDDNEHLVFHLVQGDGRACFAMTFDHRLLDARGAESFLDLFLQYMTEGSSSRIADGVCLTAPACLSEWGRKFKAGQNLNRKIIALSKTSPEALPIPSGSDKRFRFRLVSFGTDETETIYDNANRSAGFFMEMPYLLAVTLRAVHELFQTKGIKAPNYVIPVSLDMRKGEDIRQELFFNYVSYLIFKVHAEEADDLKVVMQTIKQQLYDQVKSGLPADIAEACMLTRIAPMSLMKKIFRIPFKGKIASFCFSYLGKGPSLSNSFMGADIVNILHMPRVPVPPGLGIFFTYFNGRLNMVLSSLEGLIGDEDILRFEKRMRESL
jgi:NRPS condensation-like uncharacterized protein